MNLGTLGLFLRRAARDLETSETPATHFGGRMFTEPRLILHYRVVTAGGDQFLCAAEPQYGDTSVTLDGFHVTSAGWHGPCPKRITLPALVVRYVETGEWEALGPFPRFEPPVVQMLEGRQP